jgi:hypothetical protein
MNLVIASQLPSGGLALSMSCCITIPIIPAIATISMGQSVMQQIFVNFCLF